MEDIDTSARYVDARLTGGCRMEGMTVDVTDDVGRGLQVSLTENERSIRVRMLQNDRSNMVLVSPEQARVMAQALMSAAQMAERVEGR